MNKKNFGLLIVVCIVHFILGFDINIVSISLPSISKYFNLTPVITSRIVWLYFITLTPLLLIFGKLGDIRGFKNLYLIGIIIFSVSSLMCGLSYNFLQLTLFRALQAIGSAILFGLTPAIISLYFYDGIKGKIFGINYSFVAFGGVVGRFLSGILIEKFSWHAIFLVNLPICILAFVLAIFTLPNGKLSLSERKFDLIGAMLLFSSLLGLLYFLNIFYRIELYSYKVIISIISFLVLFPLFIYRELKIKYPLLDLRILRNYNLTKHLTIFLLVYIITNGMIFITPLFLQNVFSYSEVLTGFLLTITSIAQVFAGYVSGYFSDKIYSKYILLSGLLLSFISFILFSLSNIGSNASFIILVLALYGVSVGLSVPVNTKSVMEYAQEFQKGSVSGFMITIIRIGSALGIAIFALLYSIFIEGQLQYQDINFSGYKYIFWIGAFISFIGLVITSSLKKSLDKTY
ncbi:MAG: MFS transporter [Ignavibacteria bacterium]|nr:MFS transporter [Ignavibacteria bacterium]